MKGRKPELVSAADGLTKPIAPPSWLSNRSKAEWRRVMPELTKRRILGNSPIDDPLGCGERAVLHKLRLFDSAG